MKYVAFLRGINVGGNNLINMAELKSVFVSNGFENVQTYINSGNVIFVSDTKNNKKLEQQIESIITKTFKYTITVLVISDDQLKQIISKVPTEWNSNTDLRCYISFMMNPLTTDEALKQTIVNEKVDTLRVGPGVLYMSTVMSGLTKSGFTKMIGKEFYQHITMRNYNTVKKILNIMESQ